MKGNRSREGRPRRRVSFDEIGADFGDGVLGPEGGVLVGYGYWAHAQTEHDSVMDQVLLDVAWSGEIVSVLCARHPLEDDELAGRVAEAATSGRGLNGSDPPGGSEQIMVSVDGGSVPATVRWVSGLRSVAIQRDRSVVYLFLPADSADLPKLVTWRGTVEL